MNRNKFKFATRYLVIFLTFSMLVAGFSGLIYYFEAASIRSEIEIREQERIELSQQIAELNFDFPIFDLLVVANHHKLVTNNSVNTNELTQEFIALIDNKPNYAQARFIDTHGMEIVRVNKTGETYEVVKQDLQDKSDRYYYQESIGLLKDQVYMSPFDLNVENEEVEVPHKPMVRFATPIFDASGEKQGIIILNYFGTAMLKSLDATMAESYIQQFVINKHGYWLKGPTPEDEWGFMFENGQNKVFSKVFPEAWEIIKGSPNGQFTNSEGIFTYTSVKPSINDEPLTILGHVPQSTISSATKPLKTILITVDTILIILISLLAWSMTNTMFRKKEAEQKVFELNEILKLLNKILRHDILNDVTVVESSVDMFSEEKDESLLEDILAATLRSKATIKNMRALETAIASGQELKPVNLEDVLQEVKKQFPKMSINVTGSGTVKADKALNSVLENIIRNAKMHGNTDKVNISISDNKKTVEVRIADQGSGIPDEAKSKLFTEGFKYGETGNTGLGLFIVRKTIERYGGSVSLEDNKPKGTVFILVIPSSSLS